MTIDSGGSTGPTKSAPVSACRGVYTVMEVEGKHDGDHKGDLVGREEGSVAKSLLGRFLRWLAREAAFGSSEGLEVAVDG